MMAVGLTTLKRALQLPPVKHMSTSISSWLTSDLHCTAFFRSDCCGSQSYIILLQFNACPPHTPILSPMLLES